MNATFVTVEPVVAVAGQPFEYAVYTGPQAERAQHGATYRRRNAAVRSAVKVANGFESAGVTVHRSF